MVKNHVHELFSTFANRTTVLKILEIEFTKNQGDLLLLFQAGLFSKENTWFLNTTLPPAFIWMKFMP